MYSSADAGDPQVTQEASDAALPRKRVRNIAGGRHSVKLEGEARDRENTRIASLSGEVVTYTKGDPRPELPPGNYDYEREGDRW